VSKTPEAPTGLLLSVVLIVRDEEGHLPACLEAVAGIADELVVVDTGSADGTVALAESLGARVCRFSWIDDFSAARNFALAQARGRWILVLDADDRLFGAEELRDFLAADPPVDVGLPPVESPLGPEPSAARDRGVQPRVFRASAGIRYRFPVHELPRTDGLPRAALPARILHVGYLDEATRHRKAERILALLPGIDDPAYRLCHRCRVLSTLGRLDEDRGIRIHPTTHGRIRFDHNTLVGNAVASLQIEGGASKWLGDTNRLLVAANLFLGNRENPMLGLAEDEVALRGRLDPRYLFGAIELLDPQPPYIWGMGSSRNQGIAIVRNEFRQHGDAAAESASVVQASEPGSPFGPDDEQGVPPPAGSGPTVSAADEPLPHVLVYHRPSADCPLSQLVLRYVKGRHDHAAPWANRVVSGPAPAGILRLPRLRLLRSEETAQEPDERRSDTLPLVSFDIHRNGDLVVPLAAKSTGYIPPDDYSALGWGVFVPDLDFYGAPWEGLGVRGAARVEPGWKQFPILNGGGNSVEASWCSDAFNWYRLYIPKNLPDGGASPLSTADRDALFASFQGGSAADFVSLITTALDHGMDLVPPLPFEAHNDTRVDTEGDAVGANDISGEVRVGLTYTDGGDEIDIPVVGDSATTEEYSGDFRAHWFERAALFIDAVEGFLAESAVSPDRIWMWYGEPEETFSNCPAARIPSRQAMLADLAASLRGTGRRLASYLPVHYEPHQEWLMAGLVGAVGAALDDPDAADALDPWTRRNRATALLSPPQAVWLGSRQWDSRRPHTCVGNSDATAQDEFGVDLALGRDSTGATRPVLDLPLGSMYFSYLWPTHADWAANPASAIWNVNRTLSEEWSRRYAEASANVRVLQDTNLERVASPAPVFHNPGLLPPASHGLRAGDWAGLAARVPENHARHDFWAGLHHADALWVYGWDDRGPNADSDEPEGSLWRGYRRGAEILRNHPDNPRRSPLWDGFREAMANGERILGTTVAERDAHITNPVDWIRVRVDEAVVPEADYGKPENGGGDPWKYLGRTGESTIPAVQWSARRLGNVVWLIVSHGCRNPDLSFPFVALGAFGFEATRGIVSATIVDRTGGSPPEAFNSNLGLPATLGSRRYQIPQIDAMLIRIEVA
jgi:hypothetical protein